MILSESMLKALHMREFNNHLEEGITHLKAFPGSKSQQLNSAITQSQFYKNKNMMEQLYT